MKELDRHPFAPPDYEQVEQALRSQADESASERTSGPFDAVQRAARAVEDLVQDIRSRGLVVQQDKAGTWRLFLGTILVALLVPNAAWCGVFAQRLGPVAPHLAPGEPDKIVTPPEYNQAKRAADRDRQPLIVLIGAPWCPSCKEAEKLAPQLAKRGHYVHVNHDRFGPWCRKLVGRDVYTLPVMIVYEWKDEKEDFALRHCFRGTTALDRIRKFVYPPELVDGK